MSLVPDCSAVQDMVADLRDQFLIVQRKARAARFRPRPCLRFLRFLGRRGFDRGFDPLVPTQRLEIAQGDQLEFDIQVRCGLELAGKRCRVRVDDADAKEPLVDGEGNGPVVVDQAERHRLQRTLVEIGRCERHAAKRIGFREHLVDKTLVDCLAADHLFQNVAVRAGAGLPNLGELLRVEPVRRLQDAKHLLGDVVAESCHRSGSGQVSLPIGSRAVAGSTGGGVLITICGCAGAPADQIFGIKRLFRKVVDRQRLDVAVLGNDDDAARGHLDEGGVGGPMPSPSTKRDLAGRGLQVEQAVVLHDLANGIGRGFQHRCRRKGAKRLQSRKFENRVAVVDKAGRHAEHDFTIALGVRHVAERPKSISSQPRLRRA